MKMPHSPMNLLKSVWIPILLISTFPGRASGSVSHFAEFAQTCGVTPVITSARLFSDNEKNRWKEYLTPKLVPENTEWSETAYVWGKVAFPVVIDVEGLGEDFGDSTYYCFNASGKLSALEHEFRTAWGWGFAERREFDSDGRETSKSHFFSMKDRKEIPRPQAAGEVSEAMTVKVYKNLSDVPFSRLWIHGTNAK
jgi:hypothetical protein